MTDKIKIDNHSQRNLKTRLQQFATEQIQPLTSPSEAYFVLLYFPLIHLHLAGLSTSLLVIALHLSSSETRAQV